VRGWWGLIQLTINLILLRFDNHARSALAVSVCPSRDRSLSARLGSSCGRPSGCAAD
jgi:hypothetical protein